MTTILVDSSVILDVATRDPHWFAWSSAMLGEYADQGALCINPIIYTEVSIGYERPEEVEAALPHETREELRGRRTEHIFLHCPRASVENEEAEHHPPIAPSGMSGGALIDLGDFSIPDNSIQSGGTPPSPRRHLTRIPSGARDIVSLIMIRTLPIS